MSWLRNPLGALTFLSESQELHKWTSCMWQTHQKHLVMRWLCRISECQCVQRSLPNMPLTVLMKDLKDVVIPPRWRDIPFHFPVRAGLSFFMSTPEGKLLWGVNPVLITQLWGLLCTRLHWTRAYYAERGGKQWILGQYYRRCALWSLWQCNVLGHARKLNKSLRPSPQALNMQSWHASV